MTSPPLFADRRALIAFATLCCFLWASAVPGVKLGYALLEIAPSDTPSLLLFAGLRFCLAGLMLLIYAIATGRRVLLAPRGFGEVALLGLGQTTAQYICYYVGLANTTGVKTAIMSSTLTFFSVLIAHLLYVDDRLNARRAIGCLIGFAGVIAVNLGAAGLFDFHFTLLGEGMVVLSAFAGSAAAIYGRHLSHRMDATVMTGWQLLLGGLVLSAMGLIGGGHFAPIGPSAALLIVYLAGVSAVAFALWSLLLRHNPVSSVAVFNFEIPVFGAILAALILGEHVLEWKYLAALGLVSFGIYLVTTRGRVVPATQQP